MIARAEAADPKIPMSPVSANPATGLDAHQRFLGVRYFSSLDGVRCLSILAVIWHHCPQPQNWPRFASRGFLGVDMFFVLSGFLIVTLLLREKSRTGAIDLPKFYVRRSLRIMPIYYLLLAIVAAAMLVFRSGAKAHPFWHDLPYLATYTANWIDITAVNFAIVWSLATEEQFYLLWPSVERYLKPAAILAVLAGVLVVNQLVNFHALNPAIARIYGGQVPRLSILDATFTPIALGVLLAHLLHERKTFNLVYRLLGSRWSPLAAGAALFALCWLAPDDISGLPRLGMQMLMAVLLASLVVREDHVARRVLSFAPIAHLGVISYGMYLYHQWAMMPLRGRYGAIFAKYPIAYFIMAILLTAIVSELSYRIVESPLLKLKQRYSTTRQPNPSILESPGNDQLNAAGKTAPAVTPLAVV